MAMRWCAAGMVEAGKQFRRVNGHLHLASLHAALEREATEIVGAGPAMMTGSAWPDCQRAATEVPRNSGHPPWTGCRVLQSSCELRADGAALSTSTFSVRAADSSAGQAHPQQVPLPPPAGASSGSSASDPDAAVLRALGGQLTRECPYLAEAFAMAPVLAAGCTGSRASRLGWLLSLTALGLFALYVASNSALAALGVAVILVPGCLLTSCERSRLAELERRALVRRLTQPW